MLDLQNVKHIAQNAGHTVQNDSCTMQNVGHTMRNSGHNSTTHLMFAKDQRGGALYPYTWKNFSV